jgi:hypothetical protein
LGGAYKKQENLEAFARTDATHSKVTSSEMTLAVALVAVAPRWEISGLGSVCLNLSVLGNDLLKRMTKKVHTAEDDILVLRSQLGDSKAFKALARAWHERLWCHARRTPGRDDMAWEASQEA